MRAKLLWLCIVALVGKQPLGVICEFLGWGKELALGLCEPLTPKQLWKLVRRMQADRGDKAVIHGLC